MSAEDGIRRTLARYCHLFDNKRWDDLATVFAAEASVTSRRGTFKGRAAVIQDLKSAMSDDYHGTLFASNVVITINGLVATAVSDFLEVEGGRILAVGTYVDDLVKSGDSWLLVRKEIRLKA
jgi:3-phenylpropionate/cinnamic acid dioxygenase small subunit